MSDRESGDYSNCLAPSYDGCRWDNDWCAECLSVLYDQEVRMKKLHEAYHKLIKRMFVQIGVSIICKFCKEEET